MNVHVQFRSSLVRLALKARARLRYAFGIVLVLVLGGNTIAQTSPADGPWTGSAQCRLQGSSDNETQTWTLTGAPPSIQGAIRLHPATWSGGGSRSVNNIHVNSSTSWSRSGQIADAPIAIFVRASDGRLVIKTGHLQLHVTGALSGAQDTTSNPGSNETYSSIEFHRDVYEWAFPVIDEDATKTNISGTSPVVQGQSDSMQPLNAQTICSWQFVRETSTSSSNQQTAADKQNNSQSTQPCAREQARIKQAFDAMETDIRKQFEALIQQTQDSNVAATLREQERTAVNQIESQKQQDLQQNTRGCEAKDPANNGQTSASSNTGQGPTTSSNTGQSNGSATGSQANGTGTGSQRAPAPQLLTVAPGSIEQGATNVQVTLTGRATNWQRNLTQLDLGAGITITAGPFFTQTTEAVVIVAVADAAAPGPRRVLITTNNELVGLPDGITIVAKQQVATMTPGAVTKDPNLQRQNLPPINVPAAPTRAVSTSMGKTGKQPIVVNQQTVTNQPTTGTYLITITGLECVKATLDDPLGLDGKGDEIYALAFRELFNRSTGEELERAVAQTLVYGDTNHASERVQAGSKSPLGGIQATDFIPFKTAAVNKRTLTPEDSRFPLKVWEGRLTDGVDVLVISPSVWESDGDQIPAGRWLQNMQAVGGSQLLLNQQLQTQTISKAFGAVDLGATQGAGSVNRSSIVVAGGQDRPIGVVSNGPTSTVLPHTAIVLTREIIENTAFGSGQSASSNAGTTDPNFAIIENLRAREAKNWALLKIDFVDNVTGPALGADTPGHYIMYVQIERE